jgi:hypothetical protein
VAEYIPFIPSDNNYSLGVPLPGPAGAAAQHYWFDTRWNAYEGYWYFDLYREDRTPIAKGVKIVLGSLGAAFPDDFFAEHRLTVIDTSGDGKDAGYDDLGARVQVLHTVSDEPFSG